MKSVHTLLRDRLLARAGIHDTRPPKVTLRELATSEWSTEFEQFMRNRLIMGALRYGKLGTPGKPVYDRTSSIQKRLTAYRTTGNKELLVDIANLCLCEFVECRHPLAHWHSVDDGEHVGVRTGGTK